MNLEERGEANHAAQYELGCRGKLAAQLKPPLIDIWHTPPLLDGRLLCVWDLFSLSTALGIGVDMTI